MEVYHKKSKKWLKFIEFQALDKEYIEASKTLEGIEARKESYICVEKEIDCECECGNKHKTKILICYPKREFL